MTDAQFEELKAQNAALRKDMNAGFTAVHSKFDNVDSQFAEVHSRFENVDSQFAKVHSRFENVDSQFAEVHSKFENVDAQFADMNSQFEHVKQLIERNTIKIGLMFETQDKRFDGIETRLVAVEVGQEALSDDIKGVADGVKTNGTRLDRVEASVDSLDQRFDSLIIELQGGHMDHERRLKVLET